MWLASPWDGIPDSSEITETSSEQLSLNELEVASLGLVLERMRQMRIDCNAAILEPSQRRAIYVSGTIVYSFV